MAVTPSVLYKKQGIPVRRVFYQTATKLVSGQPLCHQEVLTDTTKGPGVDVELPNTNNNAQFFGIVHERSVGVTGPAWIDAYTPRQGDRMQVRVANKVQLVAEGPLLIDYNTPTSSAVGALAGFAQTAALTNIAITRQDAMLATVRAYLANVLTAVPSTAAGEESNALVWVRFLRGA